MTRAAAYLRVSSAQQRDRVTIESQRRDVPAYIASQGWTLAGLYEDDGRTAKAGHLDAREGFARLLVDIGRGLIDVVVVVAIDRLTRSEDAVERAQVVAALSPAQLAIVGAGIQDVRTFAGDAYVTLQALFAAEENRRRRARVIAGHVTAIERGRKPRGKTPYGLTYDAATGRWGIDPEHGPVIREIVERTATGEASGTIARDLEQRGIARPRGRWNSQRVREVVHSEVYTGRFLAYRSRGLSIAVPVVVDPELAAEARAVLVGRYRRPPPRAVYHHLLTGLARCGLCGAGMGLAGTMDRATGTQPTAYRCLHRRTPPIGTEPCRMPLIRTSPLDAAVWQAAADALDATTADQVLAHRTAPPAADAVERAQAEVDRLDRLTDALLTQGARGMVAPEIVARQTEGLGRRRADALAALRAAEAAAVGIRAVPHHRDVDAVLRLLRLGMANAPAEERPGLLRDLVTSLVVGPRRIGLDMAIACATRLPGAGSSGWTVATVTVALPRVTLATPRHRAA